MKKIIIYLLIVAANAQCGPNKVLINDVCICASGYYQSSNKGCLPCQSPCTECIFQANLCLACDQTILQLKDRTINYQCICNDGYYVSGQISINTYCQPCDVKCQTCSQQNYCLSCNKQMRFIEIPQQGVCICNQGLYYDGIQCSSCDKSCFSCIDARAKCLICNYGYYQSNQPYICIGCPSKQYYDGFYQKCLRIIHQNISACNPECLSCNSTNSTCVECPQNVQYMIDLSVSFNKCPCIFGYYQSGGACFACSEKCLQCEEKADLCTVCNLESNRYLIQTRCDCLPGYYDENQAACQKCNITCQLCQSYEQCDLCITGYERDSQGICNLKDKSI